jgi:hypothetical protein
MKLIPVHALKNDLFFQPQKPWPQNLPPVAWNDYLLTGWEAKETQALVVEGDLEDLILQFYPELELSEIARLYDKLSHLPKESLSFEKLMSGYDLRFSARLEKCLQQILKLSSTAQNWIDEKKLKPSDLEILNCFEDLAPLEEVFTKFAVIKPSKQQGVEILEIYGELVLAEEANLPLTDVPTADLWLFDLRRRRYPMREAITGASQKKLEALAWPQRTKAQLKKAGDQDLLEVSFQAASAADFQKKIAQLAQMQKSIEEVRLWTSDPS